MGKLLRVLFSGRRFIFWALSPFLLLFVVIMTLFTNPWTTQRVILVIVLDLGAALLVLALFDPGRFQWAGRTVTGIIFLLYLTYFIEEAFFSGKPWIISGRRSETTPRNALLGLLIIGLPYLYYTVFGHDRHEEDNE